MGEYCCRAAGSTKSCCNNAVAPRIQGPLHATLQSPLVPISKDNVVSAPQTPLATPSPATSMNQAAAASTCAEDQARWTIIAATLGALLAGITVSFIITTVWLHKRERRQRRLKEHYETQMSKTNVYRKALESCVGSARPSMAVEDVDGDD